jgi:hypothetical protein
MSIREFAEKYGFRVKAPGKERILGPRPDRPYVIGKRGWIVEGGPLFKVFVAGGHVNLWRGELIKAGLEPVGKADGELMAWLNPEDSGQVACAARLILARKRRRVVMTPEKRAVLQERMRVIGLSRKRAFPEENPCVEGHSRGLAAQGGTPI